MSIKNTIFVSAFISSNNKHRKLEDYITYGKKFLSLNQNQIIFIEKHIFYEYFNEYSHDIEENNSFEYLVEKNSLKIFEYFVFENKIFVFFEKPDNYLYAYKEEITDFNLISDNTNKNTLEYMFVQCHKTEWLKIAIFMIDQNKDLFKFIPELIWIDFGIYHMIRNDDIFQKGLKSIEDNNSIVPHSKIRIGSCWDVSKKYNIDIYKNVAWYFAGSLFGGPTNKLIEFADLMKSKCIEIIREKKSLMWEVNVWYLIYLENPELFDTYLCNHNISIISNY